MANKISLHMKVPLELNSRIKKLTASEEVRVGRKVYIKDKYLECLEAGIAFKEKQERS